MVKLVVSKIATKSLTIGQICIVTAEFPEIGKIQINNKKYQYRAVNFDPYIIPEGEEVIILGEDKYFEEEAGQRKFLTKAGTIIQHYVTEIENDPVYQVRQGGTYKDIWFYSQDNVFPTSLVELYEEVFGESPIPKAPVVDEEAIIAKERAAFCVDNYSYDSAASYLIVDRDGDHSKYYNRVCHGPVNSPQGSEPIAVIYNLQHDWKRSNSKNRQHLHAFWDYILNRSPWAYGFLDKDAKANMAIGLRVNIDINPMEVRSVCMALRSGWESNYAQRWVEYVAEGFDEDFSFLLCMATTNLNNYSGFHGGHLPFGGSVYAERIAKFFALGHEAFPNQIKNNHYRKQANAVVSADGMMNLIVVKDTTPLSTFFRSFAVESKGSGLSAGSLHCSKEILLKTQEAFNNLVNSFKA